MLIVEVKNGESIEQALKHYKRKFQKSQVLRELRDRKEFTKPSVKKRHEFLHAVYIQKKNISEANDIF